VTPAGERLVRLARWALLALAAGSAVLAVGLARRSAAAAVPWVCPMHPEVRTLAPGACPRCGMALVRLEARPAPVEEKETRLPTGAVELVRTRVVTEPLLAPAWVEGDRLAPRAYADALATLAPGDLLTFRPSGAPARAVEVTVGPAPFPAWDASTSRVALVPAPGTRLPTGTAGWIEGPAHARRQRMVSVSALLEDAGGPYVLVQAPGGEFVQRRVRIGRTLDGLVTIVSGVVDGERVVVRSAFFVDAERRMGAAAEASGR